MFLFHFVLTRTIDPTKIIVTGKRIRFSFIGMSDIIYFDPNQTNQAATIANYQQVCRNIHSFQKMCFLGKKIYFLQFIGRFNVTW